MKNNGLRMGTLHLTLLLALPNSSLADPIPANSMNPGSFTEEHAHLCEQLELGDSTLSIVEFLCLASTIQKSKSRVEMADILSRTPASFRKNFTLKHGVEKEGERGHAPEPTEEIVGPELAKNSQGADLDFPRLMMWDEQTGFTIAYNGGLKGSRAQTGADRLDFMDFDPSTDSFQLWAMDLPVVKRSGSWDVKAFQPKTKNDNCTDCHGPHGRPIWPMYPDWPAFYGSDNDELTQPVSHQESEQHFLGYFRACVAQASVEDDAPDCKTWRAAELTTELPGDSLGDQRGRFTNLFGADIQAHLQALFDGIDQGAVADYITALNGRLKNQAKKSIHSEALSVAAAGDSKAMQDWLGLNVHPQFPYRPNHREEATAPSRAFFHRPNLRLGILYNRLIMKNLFRRLQENSAYTDFKPLVAFSLMDCDWQQDPATKKAALEAWEESVSGRLSKSGMQVGDYARHDYRILYPVLWASMGLEVRDLDMRFSYPNKRFEKFSKAYGKKNVITNPMAIGYLPYGSEEPTPKSGATHFFNSYFDGASTIDELLVARILEDIGLTNPLLAKLYQLRGLKQKYQHLKSRWVLDRTFFEQMDALGRWFPLPFPERLEEIHHREPFEARSRKYSFGNQYTRVCSELMSTMAQQYGTGISDRQRARKLNEMAMVAYRAKNWTEAIDLFRSASQADPGYVPPMTNLASLLALTGKKAEAITVLQAAYSLDPVWTANKIRTDGDFKSVREEAAIKKLLE